MPKGVGYKPNRVKATKIKKRSTFERMNDAAKAQTAKLKNVVTIGKAKFSISEKAAIRRAIRSGDLRVKNPFTGKNQWKD